MRSFATTSGIAGALLLAGVAAAEPPAQIPITTGSTEARALYLQGRDAAERLRNEDARRLFARAVEADPRFALAHLALANTAATAQQFFDEQARAVALAGEASEGERHLILAQEAGTRGDPAAQEQHLAALVEAFPGDPRGRMALGNYHFARQDYPAAAAAYQRAIDDDPGFTQAYNQLGYALRFEGRLPEAERAFARYVELIPGEPNPHDSHAELLMKMGRFRESMAAYRRALQADPHFVASYVGIATDQVLLGQAAQARRTLAELRDRVARNDGERRQALFWMAAADVHLGRTDQALADLRALYRVAERTGDRAAMSNDLVQAGQVRLRAGRTREARADFRRAVELIEEADVPPEVKENVRRNRLYFEALAAFEERKPAEAAGLATSYRAQAEAHRLPFELRRVHELEGLAALAGKDFDRAARELEQANTRDPWVLYLLARAHQGRGDLGQARARAREAADFNELSFNLAFARGPARQLAARLGDG